MSNRDAGHSLRPRTLARVADLSKSDSNGLAITAALTASALSLAIVAGYGFEAGGASHFPMLLIANSLQEDTVSAVGPQSRPVIEAETPVSVVTLVRQDRLRPMTAPVALTTAAVSSEALAARLNRSHQLVAAVLSAQP